MFIGVPKEIKNSENRVGCTPEGVKKLVSQKNKVWVEAGAGLGSGFDDYEYKKAGAQIVSTDDVWRAELIVKVKEPLLMEYHLLKENQILFTYLHLAGGDQDLTRELLRRKMTAIAYETVENKKGELPLLKPMSAIAGKMAVQIGTEYLAKFKGGRGILLDGIYNVPPGTIVIVGAGTVGQNAAHVALARGAKVVVLNRSKSKLIELQKWAKKNKVNTKNLVCELTTEAAIEKWVKEADVLVGAVLAVGAKAPIVVPEKMVKLMKKGAVIVDVAIDQGGCVATSRPTSHKEPIFMKYDVIHYCVTNMPGAYPMTSTIGLTAETLPYVLSLAKNGVLKVAKADKNFAKGINTYKGQLTNQSVAKALEMEYKWKDFWSLVR
ncbi:alanine dehydrogenase [Candidatus Woesearchaeota archaeon]|nr:alanine dehydrogenase [Candidatus Woesearchaeota archaeon]